MKTALFLAFLCSFSVACAPAAQPASTAAGRSAESFSKFVDDYFDARFAYLPTQATAAGFHQFHDAFVAQGGLPIALVRRILFRG